MEPNTNRMWWTVGLIVLGGLLISGLVAIANTNVMPRISEKANALIKQTDPDVTHTAYANIVFLCKESSNFKLSEASLVRYGSDSRWVYKELQAGAYTASNTFFGIDPASGTVKNVELVSKFSTSNSIDKTHIGTYTDKSETASQDPSKYTWKLNPDYHV